MACARVDRRGCALVLAVTVIDVGWQPFVAFRQQFPSLLSGEAFPAFRNPAAVAINHSIPGLVFKLKLFGVAGMGFDAARIVGTVYMVVAVALTVVLARRTPREGQGPFVWLVILIFANAKSFPPAVVRAVSRDLVVDAARCHGTAGTSEACVVSCGLYRPQHFRADEFGRQSRLVALIVSAPHALTVALAVVVFRRSGGTGV